MNSPLSTPHIGTHYTTNNLHLKLAIELNLKMTPNTEVADQLQTQIDEVSVKAKEMKTYDIATGKLPLYH